MPSKKQEDVLYNPRRMVKAINKYTQSRFVEGDIPELYEIYMLEGWSKTKVTAMINEKVEVDDQVKFINPELKEAIEQLLMVRELMLSKRGLAGDTNPAMTKFALIQMGWRNEVDVKLGTDEGFKIKIEYGDPGEYIPAQPPPIESLKPNMDDPDDEEGEDE